MAVRSGWENAAECAVLRTRVIELAPVDWEAALLGAMAIPLPWYRVQSLAVVAESAPEDRVDGVLTSALEQAALDSDGYRRIGVGAYVVRSALVRGRRELAERVLAEAVAKRDEVTPLSARPHALALYLVEALKMGEPQTVRVAEALLDAAVALWEEPGFRRLGRTHFNRTAYALSTMSEPLALRMLTERLGAQHAESILSRHCASVKRKTPG